MELFHGTDTQSAKAIVQSPLNFDVSKGGGELGQGFYATPSIGLAAAYAQNRFPNQDEIIEIQIDNSAFKQMKVHLLKRRSYVYKTWRHLVFRRQTHKHQFGHDIIIAPFAVLDINEQYKFESIKSQNLLNISRAKIL